MPLELGVVGLATMGQNLARNFASRGARVHVYNRTQARTEEFMRAHGVPGQIEAATSLEGLVASLQPPRSILLMVKAGPPVDDMLQALAPLLEPGDLVMDGGNSLFHDTRRREREMSARGLSYMGVGISGGEVGALRGPSIMPGGERHAYERVAPLLESIAARVDGTPCCTYIGPDGAGHFVKMVHNGIEYADIELIAEIYDLLRQALQLEAGEIAEIFRGWNEGVLQSYLIEITAEVLAKRDSATGRPLVDVIEDEAEQKGTGRWTSQSALDLGVPLTAITEAVFARTLSSQKAARAHASALLAGPNASFGFDDRNMRLVTELGSALYAAKIVAYAQGFEQLGAGSEQYGWNLDLGALATIWRGGCIIRAQFLDRIRDAYTGGQEQGNLLLAPYFKEALRSAQGPWRRTVRLAVEIGIPVPALSSALAYYDGYRRGRGPANLIQGLRDYFGSHGYRRVDREGTFHTLWAEGGAEVAGAPEHMAPAP
jgi:6-phosphogluconate dehydrogenase